MTPPLTVSPAVLILGALPALAVLLILGRPGFPPLGPVLFAWVRGCAQLLLFGLLLHALGAARNFGGTLLLLGLLWLVGAARAHRATGIRQPLAGTVALLAVVTPSLALLLFVAACALPAVGRTPLLLLALGALVGANAMNGYQLCARRLATALTAQRAEVEIKLCLGADVRASVTAPLAAALRTALLPLLRLLSGVGLVQLPGVFVGALLAGLPPLEAATLALFALELAVAATLGAALLGAACTYRLFFTPALQFRRSP